jgi:UDP-N-acetylmuramyl pentapeptide phosphotransferase/UDP-N-acetylglucosamine-1-phosphate transferase
MVFNYPQWIDYSFYRYVILALSLNGLIVFLWHQKIYKKLNLKVYQANQKIHLAETPRLGGLIILIVLTVFTWFHAEEKIAVILKPCLISIVPLFLTALKEDLFHNVKPVVRLIGLLISGALFVIIFNGPYPHFEGIFFETWLKNHAVILMFYAFALTGLANGSNLIDGVNGLCSAVFLSILGSLLFLAYQVTDDTLAMIILIIMVLIITFLTFNYPWGKIFLGDLGAYSIAFLTGMLTIIFFGRHPEISPWFPVLILIYPMTEVVFSMLRRFYLHQSVFAADTKHLHIKIFYFLRKVPQLKRYANPSVTPLLTFLWIYPLIVTPWAFKKPILILFFISLFLLVYGTLYSVIPHQDKK